MRRSIRNQKSSDESNLSNQNTVMNHGKQLRRSSITTRSSKGSMELSSEGKRPLSMPNSPSKAANSFHSKRQNINNLPLPYVPGKINPNPSHKSGPTLRENTENKGTNRGLAIDRIAKNVFSARRANAETKTRQKAKAKMGASYAKSKGRGKGKGKAEEKSKSKVSSSVSNKLKGLPTTEEEEEEEHGDRDGHEHEHKHVGLGDRHGHVGHVNAQASGNENGQVGHGHGSVNVHGHGHGKEHVDIHEHGGVNVHGHGHGKEHVDIHGHGDVGRIQRLKRSRDLILSHVNERVFKRLKMVPSRIHNTMTTTSPRTTLALAMCAIVASIGAASYFYHLKKLKEQRARTRKWW